MMDHQTLNQRIKDFCRQDNESRRVMQKVCNSVYPRLYYNWSAGGCYILADMIGRWLGPKATLMSLYNKKKGLHHVVVKVGNNYIDADGISTEKALLKKWRKVFPTLKIKHFGQDDLDLLRKLGYLLAGPTPDCYPIVYELYMHVASKQEALSALESKK